MQDNQDKESSTDEVESTGKRKKKKIPSGGEIFGTRPDRPWDPSSLLYSVQRVSFPGIKRQKRSFKHRPPPHGEVKESVELHLFFPSGPSCLVTG